MWEPLVLLDVAGIYVFALSGCLVALRRNMDVVGVLTLGLVTGFGGGVVRDVLIGDLPPQVVRTNGLLLIPVVAAITALFAPGLSDRFGQPQILAEGSRLYAIAAALGALIVAIGAEFELLSTPVQGVAVFLTVTLRLLALHFGWHAPARLGPRRSGSTIVAER